MTRPAPFVQLRVQRSDPPGRVDAFEVPADAAASLLDGLRWVRSHCDNSLGIRYACINANACKECMMRLDGKTVYACTARLEPGRSYEVPPLLNKPLLRDLITDISPGKERLFPDAGGEDD